MAMKVVSQEADYDPLCPHCGKKIGEVHWRKIQAFTQTEYLFICPSCRKILGVTGAKR